MEKIIGTLNVVCVTEIYSDDHIIWHSPKTGTATVIEKSVPANFISNPGFEHPLSASMHTLVQFEGKSFLLTSITDGLDGMCVCLMVRAMDFSGYRYKLYTDTPTPVGKTSEAVRQNAKSTIERRRPRW